MFKKILIALVTIFGSCFSPQALECQGSLVSPVERKVSLKKLPVSYRGAGGLLLVAEPPANAWALLNTLKGVDVVLAQEAGRIPRGRLIQGKDGRVAVLTKKSQKKLCEKHGAQVGMHDPLPPNPRARPEKYPLPRTKTSPPNLLFFGDMLEHIMNSPNTKVYKNASIRNGTEGQAHAYFTPTNYGPENSKYRGFVIAISMQGEHSGKLLKAQGVTERQLEKFQKFKIIE